MQMQHTKETKFFTKKDIKTVLLAIFSGTFTAIITFFFTLKSIDYENSLEIINNNSSEIELLVEAQHYYDQEEYLKVLTIYNLEKLNQNPIALNNMAYMYEHGIYVKKDIENARKYYKMASTLGNSTAENNWFLFNIAYPESYENLLKIFGINIKFERLKRKLSQEKVAEALEVSAVYISNVESGKHSISLVNANKFANFYEKTLDYLLTEKE